MNDRWHLEQYIKDTASELSDEELIMAVLQRLVRETDRIARAKLNVKERNRP